VETPSDNNLLSQFLLIFFLTIINAFFASAEMAIVSLNKNRVKVLAESGNKNAKLLENILFDPTKFLSTIQVGITLAGFFSSAYAATGLADDLQQFLYRLNVPYSGEISLVLITLALSYITLVFGELVPKQIALRKTESIALFAIRPILFISKITIPFVKFLSLSTNLIIRILGIQKVNSKDQISEDEIRSVIESSLEQGNINENEREMIQCIFEFNDKSARDVMTPRTNVFLIDVDAPLDEYLNDLIEEKYSRVPVYEENSDNIIGILYLKDFLTEAHKIGFDNVEIRKILQPPYFVNETKSVDKLFRELQSTKKYFAILIDEFGGFSGIVTMEDLVEEIMGNIYDEYDEI
jgi:putative hemolysin